MEFRNHTPFPALAFQGIDQHDQAFHVVVLRQTFTWDDSGSLIPAEEQAPLCEEDACFGEINASAVRQESDLCQYKPRCDVIVNATAYAPEGKRLRRFQVGLRVAQPDQPAPLPEPPRGLNPLQPASFEERRAWKAACEVARNTRYPGAVLIDKTLVVTGERQFVRRLWPIRLAAALARWLTLGWLRFPTWRLTAPRPTVSVPLRNDLAFGGQCRINAGDAAARRVGKRYRLKPAEQIAHPDAKGPVESRAVAHAAFAPNPIGRGYARRWYVKANRIKRLPAPQIEPPDLGVTASHFENALAGKLGDETGASLLAGLGVRPKGHPDRAKLAGTIDDTFVRSEKWLPEDFDFAVWNAAWPDQQAEHLKGDEIVELTNLSAPGNPATTLDAQGNTKLRLELPGHLPFVLVRFEEGQIGELPAKLDTVLIEPDARQLTCVWRATIATEPEVRVLEARMLLKAEVQALMEKQLPEQAEAANG